MQKLKPPLLVGQATGIDPGQQRNPHRVDQHRQHRSNEQYQAVLLAAAHRKRLGKEQRHHHQLQQDVQPRARARHLHPTARPIENK